MSGHIQRNLRNTDGERYMTEKTEPQLFNFFDWLLKEYPKQKAKRAALVDVLRKMLNAKTEIEVADARAAAIEAIQKAAEDDD